jgi:PAS domain S-box-containing protein
MISRGVLQLVHELPEPVLLVTTAGEILACNGKAARLLGRSSVTGVLQDLIAESNTDLRRYLQLCARTNESTPGAFSMRSNPASRYRFEGSGMRLENRGPRMIWLKILPHEQANNRFLHLNERITELAREVHARANAEAALRARTAQFETLLNEAPLGVYLVDSDLYIRQMNPTATRAFGVPDIIGKSLETTLHRMWPQDVADQQIQYFRRTLKTGESNIVAESVAERIDRGIRECYEWQVNRIPLPDGRFGLVCYFRDISARKQAEDALRRSEKLAAAGRLASSICHEINNPLEAVTNLLYLARNDEAMHSDTRRYLSEADSELRRMAHLAKQTLGFYRDSTLPVVFDPAELIRSVVAIYSHRINARNVRVIEDFKKTIPVHGFDGEFRQVLSNLIMNALDAMDPGQGLLTLRTRPSRGWASQKGGGVRITVADNGSGISRDRMGKIFEAFFTTKKDVGTGLGLWLSQEIVKKHEGYISVKSCVGPMQRGTVFSIFWPHRPVQPEQQK